ncbi:MAG: TetR family transcriptional regulator [Terriglobia bacterium]
MSKPEEKVTGKGEQTRSRILETALDMFCERGYEETTMRAIAETVGVALGNTYYYFRSKEQLIQAFYGRIHEEMFEACRPVLKKERRLEARLAGVMEAMLEVIEPYHHLSGLLFKTAADPHSPLNPFSSESERVKEQSVALFKQVVLEARDRVPADLQEELPTLLWLYHMGVVLFWIHDSSPHRRRTKLLVDRTVKLMAKLIALASLPLMGPLRKSVTRLLTELNANEV